MNNGTFCSSGEGGPGSYARARYTQSHLDKMSDGSFNNGNFQAQQTQMTGPGFGSSATGYRSQFHDQTQGQEIGLGNSSDDDRGSGRPVPSFDGSEFPPSSQYQGQGLYSQHQRCYSGTATNKSSLVIHPHYPMTSSSAGPASSVNHSSNFPSQRMHSGPSQNFPGHQIGMMPTLNHMLQSPGAGMTQKSSAPITSPSSRDECTPTSSHQSKPAMTSPSQSSYSMPHQLQQQGWGSHSRPGGHHYFYPQAPGSSPYRSQVKLVLDI